MPYNFDRYKKMGAEAPKIWRRKQLKEKHLQHRLKTKTIIDQLLIHEANKF